MVGVIDVTPRPVYSRERPGNQGPRACLDRCGKSRPHRDFYLRIVQPLASRYVERGYSGPQ